MMSILSPHYALPLPWDPVPTIHHPFSNSPAPSTPYTALPLTNQDPKARPSTVGACAEYQAEGAEPSTCLLQFRAGHRDQGDIGELLQCLQGGHGMGRWSETTTHPVQPDQNGPTQASG